MYCENCDIACVLVMLYFIDLEINTFLVLESTIKALRIFNIKSNSYFPLK